MGFYIYGIEELIFFFFFDADFRGGVCQEFRESPTSKNQYLEDLEVEERNYLEQQLERSGGSGMKSAAGF